MRVTNTLGVIVTNLRGTIGKEEWQLQMGTKTGKRIVGNGGQVATFDRHKQWK